MTITISHYSLSAGEQRLHDIQDRMEALNSKHRMSQSDQEEFDELADEFSDLQSHCQRLKIRDRVRSGTLKTESGSQDGDDKPRTEQRDGAMRTLDQAVSSNRLDARGAELVEGLMATGPAGAQRWTERYARAAGSEHYESAFAKLVANPERGHMEWTPEEQDAYRAVRQVQEERAMSTTDSAGGYMIPLTLDPAIMLTSSGSVNPIRQMARVVQTATDTWQGVTSAGVTAEWIAEASEVADASPTLASPSIPVHKGDAFVPFSFEVQGDAVNFMQELSGLLVDAAEQLSATAFITGSGSGQPTGLITKLVASSGTVSLITPTTSETIKTADVYAVQSALGSRFQPNAQWGAALNIINVLRQFETTNGALQFPSLQENPPMLLGRPLNEISNMDGTINPAASENNYPLVYGDFAAGMVVVDRIGNTLELVSHLFGSNRRPNGQRGALLWFRTGSDVVVPQAFRLLSIPTTA